MTAMTSEKKQQSNHEPVGGKTKNEFEITDGWYSKHNIDGKSFSHYFG
jgi:hypothetical protein